MNAVANSKTTRNVMAGAAVGGISAVGLLAFFRSVLPLPWPEEQDLFVASALTAVWMTVVSPFVSRYLAKYIDGK